MGKIFLSLYIDEIIFFKQLLKNNIFYLWKVENQFQIIKDKKYQKLLREKCLNTE